MVPHIQNDSKQSNELESSTVAAKKEQLVLKISNFLTEINCGAILHASDV